MKKIICSLSVLVLIFLSFPSLDPTHSSQACAQALQPGCNFKVLVYDLQPAGTAANLEDNNLAFVNSMNTLGYNFTHAKRATTPTISLALLQQYNLVYFWNGCGGATGLFNTAEINAIRDYYLAGGNLVIVADDAAGDSTSQGNCFDRVNQLTVNLGTYFTGYYPMPEYVCHSLNKPLTSDTSLLNGVSQSKFFSPSQLVFTGTVNWGGTLPQITAQYVDATNFGTTLFNAMGYIPKNANHGLAIFSAEREFLTGNQANCAGQTGREFWNNLIGANQVCITPTITPSDTPTSTPTQIPASPTATPTSPPLLGTCNQLSLLYSAADNLQSSPLASDQLQLRCGAIQAATRYEFRGKDSSSQSYTFFPNPIASGASLSELFTLPQGNYSFQCRGCLDSTPESCQPWE